MKQCSRCYEMLQDNEQTCHRCGAPVPPAYNPQGESNYQQGQHYGPQGQYGPQPQYGYGQPFDQNAYYGRNNAFDADAMGKSRGIAALLAIFLGSLGIQYFYLGKTTAGILTIVLSLVTCGVWGIIPLIQGILMLTMSNEQFDKKFVYNNATFPIF